MPMELLIPKKKTIKQKKKKTIKKTREKKKQKIIKIKPPGKQILNRRLRKNKITK
jgi:hypothetical protein